MSDNYEQPVEPMSRAEDILRGDDTVHPMSRVEALLKELIEAGGGGGGSTVVVTPIQQSGTKIANITVNGVGYDIFAPEGSSGSVITIDPEYQSGTLLATLTIDNTEYYIYAPAGGGGGSNLILDAQIYSTDEKQVGVWIDGKPLYQYVAVTNGSVSLNNDTYKNIPLQYTPPNIETLISGVITRETPNVGGTLRFYAKNGVIQGAAVNSYNLSADLKIIFLFTKTTDAAGSGGYQAWGFSPIIYSTEEREIGVWIDNKPLYQKTIPFTLNAQPTHIDISSLDIDSVVSESGFVNHNTIDYWLPIPYYEDAGYNLYTNYDLDNGNIDIYSGNNVYTYYKNGALTIQYTKTTDTAGSGSYNTLGVPTVHYTTDEQVIGTWVNGKPLYRKTVIKSGTISQQETISLGIANVENIFLVSDASNVNGGQIPLPLVNGIDSSTNSGGLFDIQQNDTSFLFRIGSGMVGYVENAIITVQYTKTTD